MDTLLCRYHLLLQRNVRIHFFPKLNKDAWGFYLGVALWHWCPINLHIQNAGFLLIYVFGEILEHFLFMGPIHCLLLLSQSLILTLFLKVGGTSTPKYLAGLLCLPHTCLHLHCLLWLILWVC